MDTYPKIIQIGSYTGGEISYLVGLDTEGNLYKLVSDGKDSDWCLLTPNNKGRWYNNKNTGKTLLKPENLRNI
jgi:hypothetical protein